MGWLLDELDVILADAGDSAEGKVARVEALAREARQALADAGEEPEEPR